MIMIDIEMPQCCADCFAYVGEGDFPYCRILQSDYWTYTFDVRQNRMPSCPMKNNEQMVLTMKKAKTMIDHEKVIKVQEVDDA